MKIKIVKTILAGLILLLTGGCFQANYLIRVQSDGSGTVEETFVMSKAILQKTGQMTAQLMSGHPEEPQNTRRDLTWNLFDEDKLKKSAGKMGKGVRYISGEPVSRDDFEGYKAVYRFSDICDLVISQNPSGNVPSNILEALNRRENREGQFRFRFEPGSPSKLSIQQGIVEFENDEAVQEKEHQTPADEEDREKAMTWLKQIFDPMSVMIQVELDGQIVQTNAAFREEARITLMDVRFQELGNSPDLLEKLIDSPNQSYMDVLEIVREFQGNKMEQNKEIVVEFM
jgi:PAS domain-containing protein